MTLKMLSDHLVIVFFSVFATILIGVPLGICAYYYKSLRRLILWMVEILQTVPAMALLGIIMVFLGAGKLTVVVGLLLYSLLPVVQNTHLGLMEIDPGVKEVARGMGMTRFYRLIHVEVPIAFPFIFSGIRIAVVTSVGVAVFATFVGGGGLGKAIYQAIRVQNTQSILISTMTLMVIAIAADITMAWAERALHRRSSPREG